VEPQPTWSGRGYRLTLTISLVDAARSGHGRHRGAAAAQARHLVVERTAHRLALEVDGSCRVTVFEPAAIAWALTGRGLPKPRSSGRDLHTTVAKVLTSGGQIALSARNRCRLTAQADDAEGLTKIRRDSVTPRGNQPHPSPSPNRRYFDLGVRSTDARRRQPRTRPRARARHHDPDHPIAPAWKS
jgi:hypothetical protein